MKTKKYCRETIPEKTHRFADIHCHPHMRSFNWLHKPWNPKRSKKYHPWWIILPKFKSAAKGIRAAAYSQCDMVQVTNGNLKLAIVSLYPVEKGWVTGRNTPIKGHVFNFKKWLGNEALNDTVSGGVDTIAKPLLRFLGEDKKGSPALRDLVQSIFMKLPLRKINFFQSDKYNYFKELLVEHEYLLRKNNVETRSRIFIPAPKKPFVSRKKLRKRCPAELDARGTYVVAENGKHVQEIIDQGKTAFVLSIEGANVFNSHLPLEDVQKNITIVKSWKEPLFFITFTHHFNNYLAGHAHSIPDSGTLLLEQEPGMNEGFNEKGWAVLRQLLSLTGDNALDEANLGKRILIDVKHLSVVARKEYYDNIIEPCMAKGDVIPVIASHVAYSGRKTLKQLINNIDKEKDGLIVNRFGTDFNAWNINLCDEDILLIFKTGGLIGINLDQRVLAIPEDDHENEDSHIRYVWANMKAMMKVVVGSKVSGLPPKDRVVDLLCLGTDFDGYIDPANKYATTLDFHELRADLVKEITDDPDAKKLLFGLTPEELAEKICFSNAFDFVVKNFK